METKSYGIHPATRIHTDRGQVKASSISADVRVSSGNNVFSIVSYKTICVESEYLIRIKAGDSTLMCSRSQRLLSDKGWMYADTVHTDTLLTAANGTHVPVHSVEVCFCSPSPDLYHIHTFGENKQIVANGLIIEC